jgi:hypothetical protein
MPEVLPITPLDRRLQELAVFNWTKFVALVGEENIINAKICLLHKEKRSYGEIENKLGVSKSKVRHNICKCPTS